MSNGFLCTDFFGNRFQPELWYSGEDRQRQIVSNQEYLTRIFAQIKRVIPPGGVFVATSFDYDRMAKESGLEFRQDLSFYGEETSPVISVYQNPHLLTGRVE